MTQDIARLVSSAKLASVLVCDTGVLVANPAIVDWQLPRPTLVVVPAPVLFELDNLKQQPQRHGEKAVAAALALKHLARIAELGNQASEHMDDGIQVRQGFWLMTRPIDRDNFPSELNQKSVDHQIVSVAWQIRQVLRTQPVVLVTTDQGQRVAASSAGIDAYLVVGSLGASAQELDALLAALSLTSETLPEPLEGFLPPRETIVSTFIGRKAELAELQRWLLDRARPKWVLVGDGGKGKTAIAFEFADTVKRVNPSGDLEVVLWMSAKKRRYKGGKAVAMEPDFGTLDEALDVILVGLAQKFAEDSLASKKAAAVEALAVYPTLIVVDDVDSISSENADVRSFFTEDLLRTPTRVLFTSRRELFGMEDRQTQVLGLRGQDGEQFIRTKATDLGLDPTRFDGSIDQILGVTEGSPLYIEDLLRLCHVTKVSEAVREWERRKGDAAREYALAREIEDLTRQNDLAKRVLIACALSGGPVSGADLAVILDRRVSEVETALDELRRFYLVPAPTILEDVLLFQLNPNTRSLVASLYAASPEAKAVVGALKSLGERERTAKEEATVNAVCRQARLLVASGRYQDADDLLLDSDRQYPNRAVIWQQRGWVYKKWKPPRFTDARDAFKRAEQLGGAREDLYWHWAEVEEFQGLLAEAAAIVDRGLARLGNSVSLCLRAASVNFRLARQELGPGSADAFRSRVVKAALDGLPLRQRPFEASDLKDRLARLGIGAALALEEPDVEDASKILNLWRTASLSHPDMPLVEREIEAARKERERRRVLRRQLSR